MMQQAQNRKNPDVAKWQTLDRRVIYRSSPWITLSVDTVQTDRGAVVEDFHQLQLPDFTVVVAETSDGQVLCLRQYKHGLGEVTLTFPGGMVDPGEGPLDAAKRELLEETGYVASDWHDLGSYVVHGNLGAGSGHFFHAIGANQVQAPNAGDLEDIRVQLKTWAQLRYCLRRGDIRLMNHVTAMSLVMTRSLMTSGVDGRR